MILYVWCECRASAASCFRNCIDAKTSVARFGGKMLVLWLSLRINYQAYFGKLYLNLHSLELCNVLNVVLNFIASLRKLKLFHKCLNFFYRIRFVCAVKHQNDYNEITYELM